MNTPKEPGDLEQIGEPPKKGPEAVPDSSITRRDVLKVLGGVGLGVTLFGGISKLLDDPVVVDDNIRGDRENINDVMKPLDENPSFITSFNDIPGMNSKRDKLFRANNLIRGAIDKIENEKYLRERAEKLGFDIRKDSSYYLAIALKESSLDSAAMSKHNAYGLFQMRKPALDDVNKYFPDWSFNLQDPKDQTLLGILYWHLCRDYYLPANQGLRLVENNKETDLDLFAGLTYMLGPTAIRNLVTEMGEFEDYESFVKKLVELLESDKIKGCFKNEVDETYGVEYRKVLDVKKGASINGKIKIGRFAHKIEDLVTAVRYTEIINALGKLEVKEPSLPDDYREITPPNFYLWSISTDLLEKCIDVYKIPFCLDPKIAKGEKIRLLINVLVKFNKDYLYRPAFRNVDLEDSDPDLPPKTKIYFPPKAFIEEDLIKYGVRNEDKNTNAEKVTAKKEKIPEQISDPISVGSGSSKLDMPPRNVPLYAGPDAEKNIALGKLAPKIPGHKPPMNLPTYKGRKLNPNHPSTLGVLKSPKYLILHSTAGSHESLYRTQGIHYLVRKNGAIEQIRSETIIIDHAGKMSNKSACAQWNGDGNVSAHSLGIEIETKPNEGLNNAQYKSVRELIEWICSRHQIPLANVLAHSQIGVTKFRGVITGRGRKQDPPNLDWQKLGMPNNYRRVDPDVATGKFPSNLATIRKEMGMRSSGWYGTDERMLSGLIHAEELYKRKR